MRMSLEDMDYLTVLRPPPVRAGPRPTTNKKRKEHNKNNNNKVKRKPQQQGSKTPSKVVKASKNKNRQKGATTSTSAAPPPPAAAPPAYPGPYPMYDSQHTLGYGYGYSAYDYPRYPDHIMTNDYQQVRFNYREILGVMKRYCGAGI